MSVSNSSSLKLFTFVKINVFILENSPKRYNLNVSNWFCEDVTPTIGGGFWVETNIHDFIDHSE